MIEPLKVNDIDAPPDFETVGGRRLILEIVSPTRARVRVLDGDDEGSETWADFEPGQLAQS